MEKMARFGLCLILTLSSFSVNGKGIFYTRPFARDDSTMKEASVVTENVMNKTIIAKKCVHLLVLKTSNSGSTWLSRHLKSDRLTTKVIYDPLIFPIPSSTTGSVSNKVKKTTDYHFGANNHQTDRGHRLSVSDSQDNQDNQDGSLDCGRSQLVCLISSPVIDYSLSSSYSSLSSLSSSLSPISSASSLVESFNKTISEFNLLQYQHGLKVVKFVRTNIVKLVISYSRKMKIESCIHKGSMIELCQSKRNFLNLKDIASYMYKFVSERIKYDHFFANTYLHVAEKNKNKYFLKEDEINSNNVSDLSSSENVGISNTAGSSSRGSSSDTSVSGTDNVVGDKVNVKDKEFKISRALVYTVKYEELQKDEKGTMHKLYTWLNIPYIGKNIKFIKLRSHQEDLRFSVENFGEVASFFGVDGFDLPREICPLLEMFTSKEPRIFEGCGWMALQAKALLLSE